MNVDHAWMSGPTFPPHQHAGFAAISYVFPDSESGMANRDSTGLSNLIKPGGVHWLMAGNGATHEEVPAVEGKTVHSLQIFVQVRPALRSAPASTLSIEPQDIPVVSLHGVNLRVVAGEFAGRRAPGIAPADVDMFDVALERGAELRLPLTRGRSTFFLPVHGTVSVSGNDFGLDDLTAPVFQSSEMVSEVVLSAPHGAAKVMIFSGVPYHQ
ncbi:pirin family protein [Cupriavidus agavae]|nr:pirin family protein [Cupriavidus agavae]